MSGDADLELAAEKEDHFFHGAEDELAMFGRLLTCDEVTSIYNSSCQPARRPVISGLYATATSSKPSYPPGLAVDNSEYSNWIAANDTSQYFDVDLGFARDVAKIKLLWGSVYATNYELQVSYDNASWTTVATVSNGATSYPTSGAVRFCDVSAVNGDGGTDELCVANNTRYVRLFLKTANVASGFSIAEFQVFACDVAPAACVNPYPVAYVGPQQLAFQGETVILNGALSFDPEGGVITYKWGDLIKPATSNAVLSATDTAITSFVPDVLGTYSSALVITDDGTTDFHSSAGCDTTLHPDGCAASSYPAATVVTVIPAREFASTQLTDAIAFAEQLTSPDVTTPGNRQAFVNLLNEADAALQANQIDTATRKVTSALSRTDGWTLRGTPDAHEPQRDWIVSQSAATSLYGSLSLTLDALKTL